MNFSPFNFDDSLEIRFDDVINHNINNNQSIRHINNFFSLSRNSRGRRINHFEQYLFGKRARTYDLNQFKKNKSQKLRKKYGKFFTDTIISLYKNKLLTIFRNKSGYKHLLLLYQYYLNKRKDNKKEEFLKCFISLKKILLLLEQNYEHFNKKKNFNNLLFCKVYIDLYDNYINLTEKYFDFKKRKMLYKVAIDFYKKISSNNYEDIKSYIFSHNLHFYKINAHEFYFKMSTKKYIEYFSEKLIKLNNLIGGFSNINDLFIL
jgi:hypothetical protein